jgi:hypothetical protein
MNIKIATVAPVVTQKYPYTHRIQVMEDVEAVIQVSAWLRQNDIDHVSTSPGVYYVDSQAASWLLLRWS